jgi:hypothetical protein
MIGCDDFVLYDRLGRSDQALMVSPLFAYLQVDSETTLSASGGLLPYSYSILLGSGSIDESSGRFTAPGSPETDIVRVSDVLGTSDDITIIVFDHFSISPPSLSIAAGSPAFSFAAAGGLPPYVYSNQTSAGSIDADTGAYLPLANGTDVVTVTDSIGHTDAAPVIVSAPGELIIDPPVTTAVILSTADFVVSGGIPPYAFSVVVGNGTINPLAADTFQYLAPATEEMATVRVTDSNTPPTQKDAEITVISADPLTIVPVSIVLQVGQSFTFSAFGGTGPGTYAFSMKPGSKGTIDPVTGLYRAPSRKGRDGIVVTDNFGATDDATIEIKN